MTRTLYLASTALVCSVVVAQAQPIIVPASSGGSGSAPAATSTTAGTVPNLGGANGAALLDSNGKISLYTGTAAGTARDGAAAVAAEGAAVQKANNGSDFASPSAVRSAIGAGTSNLAIGTASGTARDAAAALTAEGAAVQKANNGSDFANPAAVRSAIGAGTSNLVIGTTSGTAPDAALTNTAIAGVASPIATGSATARTPAARAADVFNPRDYGALGTGSAAAIGSTYGTTPAALASYTTSGGATPFAWANNPAYGLTFTLTTSADQGGAGATLPFTKGVSGINGWSATIAQFNGDPGNGQKVLQAGMTVTGNNIPAGTTVSSFNVSTGVVTLSGNTSADVPSGTVVTFSLSPAQIAALTDDYVGLQSAAYAATNAGGGVVQIPNGHYIANHSVWNPTVTNSNQLAGAVDFIGAGQLSTRIDFTTDLGSGACALGDSNRGVGSVGRSIISKLRLVGPGTQNTTGNAVAGMDGFCIGSKDHMDHVMAYGFHAGASILEDHGQIIDSDLSGNFYGAYFAPNGDTIGNWDLSDTYLVGEAWAGIAIAWNNGLVAAHVKNLDVGGNSPYGFYRESLPSGQSTAPISFISSTVIDNAWGESIGDGYIYGENASDSISQNTFIGGQPAIALANNSAFQISGRSVKAVIYAGSITKNAFIKTDLSNNVGNISLVADALIESQSGVAENDFGDITELLSGNALTKPIINSTSSNGNNHFNVFRTDHSEGEIDWTESAVTAGQVLSYGTQYGYYDAVTALTSASQTPSGIAIQSVAQYGMVPIITEGYALANKTSVAIADGAPVCSSPTTPGSVGPCAPGQNFIGNDTDGTGGASAGAATANIHFHSAPQPALATASTAGLVKPGTGLTVAADGTLNASGGGSGSSALLGSVSYNPSTAATYNAPGLAPATSVVDGTNLALTFTAPASGAVLVRFTSFQTTTGVIFYLAVRDTGAGADVANSLSRMTAEASARRDYYEVKLTGLTSGQSYSWTPSYSCSSSSANACYLSAGGTGTGAYGQAVFEVLAD